MGYRGRPAWQGKPLQSVAHLMRTVIGICCSRCPRERDTKGRYCRKCRAIYMRDYRARKTKEASKTNEYEAIATDQGITLESSG